MSENTKNCCESSKTMNWSERGKNWLESTKNMNLSGTAKNWYEMAKNGIWQSKSWVEEKAKAKGISEDQRDLFIKGSEILLRAPSIGYNEGFGIAWETAKIKIDKEIRGKGIISDEHTDLLIKGSELVLLAPLIGYYGGLASACEFILSSSASEDCREKTKTWFEEAKIWAEEKIRVTGISDEHRDLVLKGGGALLLAAALGYYGGIGGAFGFIFRGSSSDNGDKLMKAPDQPGKYIKRSVFEANPRVYFRTTRGKLP